MVSVEKTFFYQVYLQRRFESVKSDNLYETQQKKFLDDFSALVGRIIQSSDVNLNELNDRLTKVYRDMTDCGQEYISLFEKDDIVECVILKNDGKIIMEQEIPHEISEILMKRFREQLSDEKLDRKLDGLVEELHESVDTLICAYAQECSTGGWKGLLSEIGKKLEKNICQKLPDAVGKIVVELGLCEGILNLYVGVKGKMAYSVNMDDNQVKNVVTAIEDRVEQLYQASRKDFLDNISQHVLELAEREDMDLSHLQKKLLNVYRDSTAEVDVTDEIILIADKNEVLYFLMEGLVLSGKGKISIDVSGILLERFSEELYRNAEVYARELERHCWKEDGK